MGNSSSSEEPFADVELAALPSPLIAIDERFVKPTVTRVLLKEGSFMSSKNLAFRDVDSRSVLFRTGPEPQLRTLLDSAKQPIVHVATNERIKSIYYVHRPGNVGAAGVHLANQDEGSELLQVYVKQGLKTRDAYLDTTLRVNFCDATTGERCRSEMQGEWRARSAVLWLEQRGDAPRTALAKVYRPKSAKLLRDRFTLEIAPNVDVALVLLVCAIVDDDLKRTRLANTTQADHEHSVCTGGISMYSE